MYVKITSFLVGAVGFLFITDFGGKEGSNYSNQVSPKLSPAFTNVNIDFDTFYKKV